MKKIYIIIVLALGTLGASGQGGSWYVGGLAGFNNSKTDANANPVTTSWSFGPEVGYFFNAQWSAGLALGLNGSSNKDDNGDISKSSTFMPDLYVRHWWNVGERLNLFAGVDLTAGSGSTTTYRPVENKVDNSAFGINVNAGIAYAMAQRWTLLFKFAGLGYSSSKTGNVTTNNFGLVADGNVTNNQFIFIGVYWTFIQP